MEMQIDSKKEILLNLFKSIYPFLKIQSLKDLLNCETIWGILLRIDRHYFQNVQNHIEYSLVNTLETIGEYLSKLYNINIRY